MNCEIIAAADKELSKMGEENEADNNSETNKPVMSIEENSSNGTWKDDESEDSSSPPCKTQKLEIEDRTDIQINPATNLEVKEMDLRPEVLAQLSPRTLHRTLYNSMLNVNDLVDIPVPSPSIPDDDPDLASVLGEGMYDNNRIPQTYLSRPRPRLWIQPRSRLPSTSDSSMSDTSVGYQEFEIRSLNGENENPIEDLTSSTEDADNGSLVAEMHSYARKLEGNSTLSSHQFCPLSTSASSESEEDLNNFADSSDSASDFGGTGISTDSELSEHDKWYCTQCSAKTNSPYFRYCLRCFTIRRNWLPTRPKGRNRKRLLAKGKKQRQRATADYVASGTADLNTPRTFVPGSTPESDLPVTPESSKEEGLNPQQNTPSSSTTGSQVNPGEDQDRPEDDSGAGPSSLSNELQSALNAPPVSVSAITGIRDDTRCIICMVREKNSVFVHGKLAHFCCCFSCGDKVLKASGRCPLCRKKILRVSKVIS